MKTIHVIKCSLCFLISLTALAQTSKTFKESFNVSKTAEVSLNIANAEITIETWNKNRVEVEAEVTVDGEDQEINQKILDNFNFEALGNSTKVEVQSGRMRSDFNYRDARKAFGRENTFRGPQKTPPAPPMPPLPPLPPSIEDIELDFDMEKFNSEGKEYLIKFQDSIKAYFMDSDFKQDIKEWQKQFAKEWKESGIKDSLRVITYKLKEELRPALRKLKKDLKPVKNNVIYYEARNKIKTKIIIKIPKDAKLDLNVKRSQLKIASINHMKANLNYSGLQLSNLHGNNNIIRASHSRVNIDQAESLNLNLSYSKNTKIVTVNHLVLSSKTSNVLIGEVVNQAIIEGSFGDLTITKINSNFNLIDINLKNSKANLTLPNVNYNFYMNSKLSRLNLKNDLDFKVTKGYDTNIYQNSQQTSSNKALNIKANFSEVILN